MLSSLTSRFTRRKQLDATSSSGSSLSRCLTTLDLTLLGIGSTLGVGVYVLAGGVARDTAGPSVVLSFLIAGVASALSGLCYAEFGARVPRAGSAYVYSYVTVGELAAFVIGWNLILEYVIGTASVARGYSGYLDSLLNNSMKEAFRAAMPINEPFLAEYPDWTAFAITLVLAVLLSVGVRESTRFNNIFTILNLCIVIFVVLAGMSQADVANWSISVPANTTMVSETKGAGGFFPFGFSGTLSGAATCFYGFVGFDAIATTGEETKNPQKSIPIAILVSLSFVSLAYTGISSTLTLMLPYYLQDSAAPLPFAFHHAAMPWAGWIVSIGALFGLSTSLLGAMFPLPRVLYAMASDGVIPRALAKVHPTFQTPLAATLFSGLLAAFMALVFDLSQLVDMMSIGTLLAYTMVGLCVLLLRYRDSSSQSSNFCSYKPLATNDLNDSEEELFPCNSSNTFVFTRKEYMRQLFNLDKVISPTPLSSHVAQHSAIMYTILCIPFSILVIHGSPFHHKLFPPQAMLFFMILKMIFSLVVLNKQPQDPSPLPFSVPLVPWLPAASVLINIFLTLKLSWQTWVRFSVWMLMGFMVYGGYGWRNSSEEYRMKGQVPPNEDTNDLKLGKFDQNKNENDLDDIE
eukprot:TRINITY_DN26134_c0_g1_i1.p1 TRINITY_DN26134_c0_g1~~TRINITY_DN26134_c0_g1_i1.p1  ORF type:complete len:632 (+),score=185.25 TRINITY_DN26134_c0_g1_i1:113-2008(+)